MKLTEAVTQLLNELSEIQEGVYRYKGRVKLRMKGFVDLETYFCAVFALKEEKEKEGRVTDIVDFEVMDNGEEAYDEERL